MFFCSFVPAKGQSSPDLPLHFQQFFRNYSIINPAAIATKSNLELFIADRSLTGGFTGVNKFAANLNYRLGSNKDLNGNKPGHAMGMLFSNDKVGTYIGRTRGYVSYAVQLPIRSGLYLRAGTSIGFANYYYLASQLYPGNSSIAPTGDVGLWLYSYKFNLGFSIGQIFSGVLRPFRVPFQLAQNYNITFDKTIQVNHQLTILPALWIQWTGEGYTDVNLASSFILQEAFSAGMAYKYQKGFTIYTGLEKINLGKFNLKWMVSYYARFQSSNSTEVQSIEMSLFFLLKNKDELSKQHEIEDENEE